MHWGIIVILLIVVIIFGVSSSMQSYATAQQAQAQIELARAAQVNAWGNLVTLLVVALLVLLIIAVLAAIVLFYIRRIRQLSSSVVPARASTPAIRQPSADPAPVLTQEQINQLIMLKILETLQPSRPQLPAAPDQPEADEPLRWLKD